MKKLMSILLAILMLIPLIASCGGNDETTTTETPTTEAPTTETPTTEVPTTEAPTTEAPKNTWSSKTDIRDTWSGKTLNVACSKWYSSSAPWAMPETFITEENDAKFGAQIQQAVLDRNKFIESTYGVKVNWIDATSASMHNVLEAATIAKNINYDLAAPRMMNVQSVVAGGYVYDLAGREFIDFENSYYRDESIKTYTAHGHTFFVTGGFSTLDIDTSSVLFFNKDLLTEEETNDIYNMVRKGEWTFDKLVAYASDVYSDNVDKNNPHKYPYGVCLTSYSLLYNFFGVKQTGVDSTTGKWEITIDDDRVDNIIDIIIESNKSAWFADFGGYTDFVKNKLLFYNYEFVNSYVGERCNTGIVPFPMLNKEQGRYYVPCSMQKPVVLCIPKITQDRAMSDYFMDVLCWTGEEYTTKAYLETKKEYFKTDADMEMITEYIIPNISYDAGEVVEWGELISIKTKSYKDNENHFDEVYAEAEPDALKIIAEWNAAWGGYTEE